MGQRVAYGLITTILLLRCTMTESGRHIVLTRPKPTGILTECAVKTNASKASNAEFDREYLSKMLHITSQIIDLCV